MNNTVGHSRAKMPTRTTNGHTVAPSRKRKRSHQSSSKVIEQPPPTKEPVAVRNVRNSDKSARKQPQELSTDDEDDMEEDEDIVTKQAEIMQLEQEITASSENYNNIVKLLDHLEVSIYFQIFLCTFTNIR